MKYEFVSVAANKSMLFGLDYYEEKQSVMEEKNKCRGIITEMAEKGWRYKGWIPNSFNGEGAVWELDLVFERED